MILKRLNTDKKKRGFSLIEIMLALLVVSIGIVAMIGLLGSSLDSSAKAHDDLSVVSFADMVFNYCHAITDWNDIATDGTILIPDYSSVNNAISIGSLNQFDCQVPDFGDNPRSTYTISYLLNIEEFGNTKELTLRVWPGLSTNGSERIFYTEIYNWAKN